LLRFCRRVRTSTALDLFSEHRFVACHLIAPFLKGDSDCGGAVGGTWGWTCPNPGGAWRGGGAGWWRDRWCGRSIVPNPIQASRSLRPACDALAHLGQCDTIFGCAIGGVSGLRTAYRPCSRSSVPRRPIQTPYDRPLDWTRLPPLRAPNKN